MKLLQRFRFWMARPRLHEELADELRAHQDMLEDQFARDGMSPNDARAAARARFGGELSSMEQSREEWGFRWMDALLRDSRFALRMIRRQPMLAATIVLITGLGVGANTAIVSVLRTALLRPLGLCDSSRVMAATVRIERINLRHAETSGVEFRELQSMTDAFAAVAAAEGRWWTALTDGKPSRLIGRAVTPDYFRVFNERPFLGRFFTPEDRESVVLSYGLWRSRFGGDRFVPGRAMTLDGKTFRVVGVASERFQFPAGAQAWTPLVLTPVRLRERGNNMMLSLTLRLKDGVTPAQAEDRVSRYVAALKSADSPEGRELKHFRYFIDLEPLANYVAGDLRRPLLLIWAAALALLFAGCANIAALLLSRTAGRRREMAIRLSLGATRFQIVRQLAIESLLLGMLGGVVGLGVGAVAVTLVTRLAIPGRYVLELVTLDRTMMLYGLGLSVLSGLVFGLAPAVQLLRASQTTAMARGARHRFQDFFVSAQVATALVLLIGTGLLLRSLRAIERIHPGFDPSNITTGYLIKPKGDPGFIGRLDLRLRSSPGVQSAALAYPVPFSGGGLTSSFLIHGRQKQAGEPEYHGEAWFVSPTYFDTLGIPLLRGRSLAFSDAAGAPHVCVIDAKLAQRFFPHREPLGQEIGMYGGWARIIGVVAGIHGASLEQDSRPMVYYSLAQSPFFDQAVALVKSPAHSGALIRQAVAQTNGSVPVFDIQTLRQRMDETLGIRRVVASLVTVFAVICIVLVTIGLHGVVAQVVGERTPEIGVRVALGAKPSQILTRFVLYGMRAGAIGLVVGLGLAAWTQKWLTGMLYEVRPFDPLTVAQACAGTAAVLLISVFWPARRAAKIDPQTVLRHE